MVLKMDWEYNFGFVQRKSDNRQTDVGGILYTDITQS